jgi:hypothetical protein
MYVGNGQQSGPGLCCIWVACTWLCRHQEMRMADLVSCFVLPLPCRMLSSCKLAGSGSGKVLLALQWWCVMLWQAFSPKHTICAATQLNSEPDPAVDVTCASQSQMIRFFGSVVQFVCCQVRTTVAVQAGIQCQ